ncbi:MAG: hypothetical protein OEL78_03515, partial [Hyphomicrobiales bacterium]|nr:hypothetical protein [Hyphomicrobiales bacterium]
VWILDAHHEENLIPIATCPLPSVAESAHCGGRFGANNIHENIPTPKSWQSDQIILGTFFNDGLRAFDISNPCLPREIAHFVPPAPPFSPTGSIQLNDVFADERGIVYTADRHVGGLCALEMDM